MLSPDGCIDASTGALPFNTWYIKNLEHQNRTDGYIKLMNAVAYGNLDINSDASYPQFLVLGEDGQSVIPQTKTEPEKKMTFVEECIALVKRLIEIIIDKLTGIFKK